MGGFEKCYPQWTSRNNFFLHVMVTSSSTSTTVYSFWSALEVDSHSLLPLYTWHTSLFSESVSVRVSVVTVHTHTQSTSSI